MVNYLKGMRLSIVIITWNQIDHLVRCLQSLERWHHHDDTEIIVVDNGSCDGSVEYVKQHYPQIVLICNEVNTGVSHARNQGMRKSKGDVLLFVDNDTEIPYESVAGMLNYIENHPEVGICACSLVYDDGSPQDNFKPFPGLIVKFKRLLRLKSASICEYIPVNGLVEPCYVIGACQMVSRQAMETVGCYDENIFYGPEDADYCLRMRRHGYRVVGLTNYKIKHHCRRISNHQLFSKLSMKHICSLFYLYYKYCRII